MKNTSIVAKLRWIRSATTPGPGVRKQLIWLRYKSRMLVLLCQGNGTEQGLSR